MNEYTREELLLFQYVNSEINSGKKEIAIPKALLHNVRREIFEEIIRLCKLNGVRVEMII